MFAKGAFHCDLLKSCYILYKEPHPRIRHKVRLLLTNMGVQCIAVYRFGRFAKRLGQRHRILGRLAQTTYLCLNYLAVLIHKVQLHVNSEIGPGFHISHVGNIYIGACRIGANCTVTHNVTIGLGFNSADKTLPTIGNNVWIGTGSVLTGDITIGDGVAISAGSIVTRSFPSRCLVSGNPARVIGHDYDNSRMLVYKGCEHPGGATASYGSGDVIGSSQTVLTRSENQRACSVHDSGPAINQEGQLDKSER